jgi:hypothetical protein
MTRRSLPLRAASLLVLLSAAGVCRAAEATAADALEQLKFFETRVRPVLVERCLKCHGPDKQEGQFRLDSRESALAGGESGPAVVPGKPDESLLVEAINRASLEMPPDARLPDHEIAALTKWVELGAPWPAGDTARLTRGERSITDEDREFWSYQPLREPVPPDVADGGWRRNEVDQFIFEKLSAHGLAPAGEAERTVLARRLYEDVIGLPPTPEQVDAFLSDESPQAYERLVDKLLDSPHYGEHWARFWLDLVRYAESDGYKADGIRPNAWRYRDYVVRAFNTDKPYDRFVLEQLAGDEIAPYDPDALMATGYYRHVIYEYNQRDPKGQWRDILNDLTDNVADTFLATGMGCARCHDHKFDPILQRDYYRLQGFLTNLWFRDDVPLAAPDQIAAHTEQLEQWRAAAGDVLKRIAEVEAPRQAKGEKTAVSRFSPDIQAIWAKPAAERNSYEKQIAHLVWLQVIGEEGQAAAKLNNDDKAARDALQQELAQFDALRPAPLPLGQCVMDIGPVASAVFVPGKEHLGEIEPGVPTLFDAAPAVIEPPPDAPQSTGRRTALARWLTQPEHPLTSRVIVNRVWQQHFGTGLVATPSDFGRLGEPPSHPELLDWLATQFVSNGWSLKWLHRTILTSATFRQASRANDPNASDPDAPSVRVAEGMHVDPANRLLWRFPIRRLTAEQIRDAMLAVSGELSLETGGPGVDADVHRRSVYLKALRNTRDPLLDVFDLPDRILGTGERNVTTTPGQSLLLINGEWGLARGAAFAQRLEREIAGSDDSKVRHAYRLAYGRDPSSSELLRAVEFLGRRNGAARSAANDAELATELMPATGSPALPVHADAAQPLPRWDDSAVLPEGDFTVSAVVLLRSLYADASVRTIVSQWDGDTGHPGWSLGVTSAKSKYTPRNLILQLVGKTADGGTAYEVVPSGLHLELDRPYFVAVTVRITDTIPEGTTFVIRDLSRPESGLQTASAGHRVVTGYRTERALVIGGRDGITRHRWDGLIDDVRLSSAATPASALTPDAPPDGNAMVGWWRFDAAGDSLADNSPHGRTLRLNAEPLQSSPAGALVDLCHVLLNSSEFLYVD